MIGTRRFPWADAPWRRYEVGMVVPTFDGDPDLAPLWAGESVGSVRSIEPAGEIVRDLVRETEDALGSTGPSGRAGA